VQVGYSCAIFKHVYYRCYYFLIRVVFLLYGVFFWVLMRYNELRLFVKMCAGSLRNSWVSICRIWWMAAISARSMFCKPISL
jgi:hypothetical protein